MQQINEMLLPFFQIGFLLCVAFLLIWNRVLILRVVKFRREKKIIECVSIGIIIPIILFFQKEFVVFSFVALVLLCIGRYFHSEGLKNVDENLDLRRKGMYFSYRYANIVSLTGVALYILHIIMSL